MEDVDRTQSSLIADAQALSTVDELRAVHSAAIRLHHVFEPRELAAETIRVLEDTLGYDHAAVLLLDEHSDRFIPFALSDRGQGWTFVEQDTDYLASHDIGVHKGITGWVATHGQSVRSGNIQADERYYGLRDDISSELCVPMKVGGRLLGVVNIETRQPDAFTESDQRVLEIVAAQIATAVENSRLHQDLVNAQRLEAVGRLTSGIAHDFNNSLTVINGQTELLLMRDTLDQELRAALEQIRQAAQHATDTTRQLLAFGRKASIAPQVFDPRAAIDDLRPMLSRLLGEKIDLTITSAADTPPIEMDPTQFSQVLVNLAINARDAMPDGGRLSIDVHPNRIDRPAHKADHSSDPGRYTLVSVRDTGIGMDRSTIRRLFEPFFTTKSTGTGLGLAMAHGVLRQCGGYIRADSEPGEGAEFRLYFPVAEGPIDATERERAKTVLPRLPGSVLIAEDDPAVRRLVASLVESLGYDVVQARSGFEALALAGRADTNVSVLLSDVAMPKMTGPELAARLRALHPHIKTLFMSGYPKENDGKEPNRLAGDRLIAKPFTRAGLKRALREVLEETS